MTKLIPALLILLFALPALAESDASYGLAMHGDPKYNAASAHLEYANPDAPHWGTLRRAAIGTFDSVNPFAIKGKSADGLALITDRLMARVWDEAFTMYPLIAERIDVAEDRSAMTVHINPKARFHDSSPITADDVIFSFETLRDSGRPNMRRIYSLASAVEKRGEHTVHFAFGEGHDAETVMIFAMMPVLSKAYWQDREFDSSTLDIPLTNGPYKIADIDPGRRIVYERVDNYWAADLLPNVGHNNFDRVIYDYYRDESVAFEAFKSGDIDVWREPDAGRWITGYRDTAGLIKAEIAHGRPEKARGFIFNTRRPPFDDIRVRRALAALFDHDWAAKTLYHDQVQEITSYFANSELAALPANGDVSTPREEMRRANQLLEEAGWSVENGQRVKDGQPLTFEIIMNNPEDEKLALHFKKSLERMGITPSLRVLDTSGFTRRLQEYDYDMVLHHWQNSLSPGTEQMLYWSCEAADQPGRFNYAGICDPEIDRLAASIAQTTSRAELINSARTLDSLLMRGQYMIPLFYKGKDYMAYWEPLDRPDTTPVYGPVLETWWMNPADSQKQD